MENRSRLGLYLNWLIDKLILSILSLSLRLFSRGFPHQPIISIDEITSFSVYGISLRSRMIEAVKRIAFLFLLMILSLRRKFLKLILIN